MTGSPSDSLFGSARAGGARRSLTRQAAGGLLLSLLPVLVVLGFVNYQYAQAALQREIRNDIQLRTQHVARTLSLVLARELERLTGLSADYRIRPPLTRLLTDAERARLAAYTAAVPGDLARQFYQDSEAGQVLRAFQDAQPNRAVVVLADRAGSLRAVSTPAWPYGDLATQPWWADLAQGTGRVAQPVSIPGLGTLLLLTVPVGDPATPPVGLLTVGLKFAPTARPALSEDATSDTTALLITSAHTILYATPRWPTTALPATWTAALQAPPDELAVAEGYLVAHQRLQFSGDAALDRPADLAALASLDWVVVRVMPTARAFAPLQQQFWILAAGTAGMVLLVVAVAVLVVQRLVTRPLRRLQHGMTTVTEEGLTPAVIARATAALPHPTNEIGTLTHFFTQMLQTLVNAQETRAATIRTLRATAARLATTATEQEQISSTTSAVVTQVVTAFSNLDAATHLLAETAQAIDSQATDLQQQNVAGDTALITLQAILAELQQTARLLEEGARNLATTAQEASTLSTEANAVAESTHILSLNATIEAVSAGPYGARFGVIAQEIRTLATAAARAAQSIDAALRQVVAQTITTAGATHQARLSIDGSAEHLQALQHTMQILLTTSDQLTTSAAQIRANTAEQRGQSREVQQSAHQMASAISQVMLASRHVTEQAARLLVLAQDLEALV